MTDKVTLNYLLIYGIAVPYYLFFNVEVTSSWIPEMKALLYHDGFYSVFYVSHDPLDNAVPSLHVAIPFGILLLNWMHCRERGIKMKEWTHYRYHLFILANTVLFIFTILYLGIHWFVDIPLGMLVGGIGALFIHQVQPRLRNDYGQIFKGITKRRWRGHLIVEGAATLVMVLLLMSVTSMQPDYNEEQPSYRLGEGDSTFEIVQKIDYYESVDTYITNMNEESEVLVAVIASEYAVQYMEDGQINWSSLSESDNLMSEYTDANWSQTRGRVYTLQPQQTGKLLITQPDTWHLVIFHYADGSKEPVMEVKVVNDYHQPDSYLTRAYLLSIPSLWITAWVLHRLWRMKQNGVHWLTSTPSHAWPGNGNGGQTFESE